MQNIATIAVILAFAGSAFAAEPNLSKEDRQKMADMHTQMASCLKSDRPLSECQQEMISSCQMTMGQNACPLMGIGQMHGIRGNGMMQGQGKKSESK